MIRFPKRPPNQILSPKLRSAIRMQELARNPLTEEEIDMFAMFERDEWDPERRRAFIRKLD